MSTGAPSNHAPATRCRGCDAVLPAPFLDLGRTPLANSYLRSQEAHQAEETYPLATAYCPQCHLVQLTETVAPEKLFSEYLYFSSFSDSFLEHSRLMAEDLTRQMGLGGNSLVLEIASNDGYLLQYFQRMGIPVLGVDPARNIAEEANRRGIPTLCRFFGEDTAPEIAREQGLADLILGNNVLAHVPAINSFLRGVRLCLKPQGAAAFEFPYLRHLLERTEFDTIYHEHVFYYSLSAIRNLAHRAGLELWSVIAQPVHGGSLRVFLQHPGTRPVERAVDEMLASEAEAGLTTAASYASFGQRVASVREQLLGLLRRLKSSGRRIAAYGAPAKGNTLLNYCRIGADLIEFTVDRSPHKQGLFLPGSHIPIKPPAALLDERPDFALILPWNITDEIMSQQTSYQRQGGRFIVPIPQPRILEPAVA